MKNLLTILCVFITLAASSQTNGTFKAIRSVNADSVTVKAEIVGLELFYGNVGAQFYDPIQDKWRCYTTGAGWYDCDEGGGGSGINIYNADGTLDGDRVLTGAGFDLTFTGIDELDLDATTFLLRGLSSSDTTHFFRSDGTWAPVPGANVETVVAPNNIVLALTDIYKKIQVTKNTAHTITIPTDAGGTNWVPGMWFYAEWYGGASGQTTFVPDGGVTVHSSSNTLVIPGQYSLVYCEYIGGDVWNIQNGSPATSWAAFTPTVVGFSGSPTYNFRYLYVPSEKRCTISFQMAASTPSGTTFTITTPITSAATFTQTNAAQIQNNSVFDVGTVSIPASSTTMTISLRAGGGWSTSGTKSANFSFTYETL